jgi:hypothetical protein
MARTKKIIKRNKKYSRKQRGGDKTYEDFLRITDLCKDAEGRLRGDSDNDKEIINIAMREIEDGKNDESKKLLNGIKLIYNITDTNITVGKLQDYPDLNYRVATALYRIHRYKMFIPFIKFFGKSKTIKTQIITQYEKELKFVNEIIKNNEIPVFHCNYKSNNSSNRNPKIPLFVSVNQKN